MPPPVSRAVINADALPVCECLRKHRGEAAAEVGFGIVDRYDDRNFRAILIFCHGLLLALI